MEVWGGITVKKKKKRKKKRKKEKKKVLNTIHPQSCTLFSILPPNIKNLQWAPTKFYEFSISPFRKPFSSDHTEWASRA